MVATVLYMESTQANRNEFSTIGNAYGRESRTATAKEMALAAGVVGSKDGMLMVERATGQAWKWTDHFNLWVTMPGWTGGVKKAGKKWVAIG